MKPSLLRARLRALLSNGRTVVAPGAYDPLTAIQVERAGFDVVYVGSYALASSLGLPDVGILDMSEMASRLSEICNAVSVPIIADAENGFFNAAGIGRVVRAFEKSGISGIHIEDHESGKHTNLPKRIIPLDQMVEKIRAALDAREDPDFLIIARTDVAWATGKIADAVERMIAFSDAGADAVMPTGITVEQLSDIRRLIPAKIVIVNSAPATVADEQAAGADLVIYHSLCLYAATRAVTKTLETFRKTLDLNSVDPSMARREDVDALLGYDCFNERAKHYKLT